MDRIPLTLAMTAELCDEHVGCSALFSFLASAHHVIVTVPEQNCVYTGLPNYAAGVDEE